EPGAVGEYDGGERVAGERLHFGRAQVVDRRDELLPVEAAGGDRGGQLIAVVDALETPRGEVQRAEAARLLDDPVAGGVRAGLRDLPHPGDQVRARRRRSAQG